MRSAARSDDGARSGGGDADPPTAVAAAVPIPSAERHYAGAGPSSPTGAAGGNSGRALFPAPPYARWTKDFVARIRERLREAPAKVVAHSLGMTPEAFRMRMARRGISLCPTDARGLTPRMAQAYDMREAGRPLKEIAAEMGISDKTAALHVARARRRLRAAGQ